MSRNFIPACVSQVKLCSHASSRRFAVRTSERCSTLHADLGSVQVPTPVNCARSFRRQFHFASAATPLHTRQSHRQVRDLSVALASFSVTTQSITSRATKGSLRQSRFGGPCLLHKSRPRQCPSLYPRTSRFHQLPLLHHKIPTQSNQEPQLLTPQAQVH